MADNRPSVYVEDDKVIYRASSVGDCTRALVASSMGHEERRGKEVNELLSRSANEGNLHEDAVRQLLVKEGWEVLGEQDVTEVRVLPGVFIRGHTDGVMLSPDGEEMLLEVKTMSTKQFAKWQTGQFKQFPKYAYQISCYMRGHRGLDVMYMVKRREDGMISRLVIPGDEPPVSWGKVAAKVALSERARKKGDYPKCDVANQWGCPFWYLHDEVDPEDGLTDLSDDEIVIIGDLAQGYLELKALEEAGKEAEGIRKANFNRQLLNMLGEMQNVIVEHEGALYKVRRGGGGGSRFDKDQFIEDYGLEEYQKYVTKYSYSYPVVSIVNREE